MTELSGLLAVERFDRAATLTFGRPPLNILDLDLLAEITKISIMFAVRHGQRLGQELGMDPTTFRIDMDGVKAGFGVDSATDQLTYRDLQARRELIQKRMRDHVTR